MNKIEVHGVKPCISNCNCIILFSMAERQKISEQIKHDSTKAIIITAEASKNANLVILTTCLSWTAVLKITPRLQGKICSAWQPSP